MPVFTFSTKTKKPQDTREVEELKKDCEQKNINFSAVVVGLIKEYNDDRRAEV